VLDAFALPVHESFAVPMHIVYLSVKTGRKDGLMIASEFLFELEKVHSTFRWALTPDPAREPERRSGRRLRIRGTCKHASGELVFEPIGALCYARTGKIFGVDAWIESANELKLSLIDAGDLTAAANDRTWASVADSREPVSYVHQLRIQLVASVGLGIKP
jgi:hypothetical protein